MARHTSIEFLFAFDKKDCKILYVTHGMQMIKLKETPLLNKLCIAV